LPTGSLKAFTRYLMRVIPKYKNSNAVVTRFTLKKSSSNTGINYSQTQFAVERALSPEEYSLISAMTEQVKALSRNVGYETEDSLNIDPETGEIIEPLS
jgi:cupin superfamily acireductone dioxygenase involved in methionine salvage